VTSGSIGTSIVTRTSSTYIVGGTHRITAAFTQHGLLEFNLAGALPGRPVDAQDGDICDHATQPIGRWWVHDDHGQGIRCSSGPIRLITDCSVNFYFCLPIGPHTLLGSETLDATGKMALTTSTLTEGVNNVFAVYVGASSTSLVIVQFVVATVGHFSDPWNNWQIGYPGSSRRHGAPGTTTFTS
jgi:hypothetical protein